MLKLELNYHDWLDKMWSIMKNREDNEVTDRTGVIFAQQDTKLLRLIWWGIVYDEDWIWERHDQSYRSNLYQNQN